MREGSILNTCTFPNFIPVSVLTTYPMIDQFKLMTQLHIHHDKHTNHGIGYNQVTLKIRVS